MPPAAFISSNTATHTDRRTVDGYACIDTWQLCVELGDEPMTNPQKRAPKLPDRHWATMKKASSAASWKPDLEETKGAGGSDVMEDEDMQALEEEAEAGDEEEAEEEYGSDTDEEGGEGVRRPGDRQPQGGVRARARRQPRFEWGGRVFEDVRCVRVARSRNNHASTHGNPV